MAKRAFRSLGLVFWGGKPLYQRNGELIDTATHCLNSHPASSTSTGHQLKGQPVFVQERTAALLEEGRKKKSEFEFEVEFIIPQSAILSTRDWSA